MKYKIELESLLSAVRYCAEADNNKEVWKRWNLLNVSEQIKKLSNVTFFEEEPQTIEQAKFMRQRVENALKNYRETDKQIDHFFDTIEETPDNNYLYACWSMIEQHLMNEGFELLYYIKSVEPEQQQTPKQDTPNEKLKQRIKDDIDLLLHFEPELYNQLNDEEELDNLSQKVEILANQVRGYIESTLVAQEAGKTRYPKGKSRYQDILKKGIDEHKKHDFGSLEPQQIIFIFKRYGIELHYSTVSRWRKQWNKPEKK